MYKFAALFALFACASAQVLRLSPLQLGSRGVGELQTINLAHTGRLARGPIAAYAAPQIIAAPQIAYAPQARWAAPIARGIGWNAGLAGIDESPKPYTFGFTSSDEYGTQLGRQEQADGSGSVTGSYSLAEADGRQRIVEYVADGAGFRANIRTNEPGTANANPADVQIQSSAPSRR